MTPVDPGRGQFGYVRYLCASNTRTALLKTRNKYKARIAEPQTLPSNQRHDPTLTGKTLHRPCGNLVMTRTLKHHEAICERQRSDSIDPGEFTPAAPSRTEHTARQETLNRKIPRIHISLSGDPDPPRVHEVTGKEADPLEGVLWESTELVAVSTEPATRIHTMQGLSAEEAKDLTDYLNFMRTEDLSTTMTEDDLLTFDESLTLTQDPSDNSRGPIREKGATPIEDTHAPPITDPDLDHTIRTSCSGDRNEPTVAP